MNKCVLVLEDDLISLKIIRSPLERHGFSVLEASDRTGALDILANKRLSAAILDLNLPDISGIDVLKLIRNHPVHAAIPIIILTSNNDKTETVIALEMGADDYITKPFNERELVARLNAHLRRAHHHNSTPNNLIAVGNIIIDLEKREVMVNQKPVHLTYNEFELLLILVSNAGKVLSRDNLLNRLWGYDFPAETRTIDIHISSLRKKLSALDPAKQYIETVRSVGYRFV